MKLLKMETKKGRSAERRTRFGFVAVLLAALGLSTISFAAAVQQKSFGSAEEAVKALVTAAKNNDSKEILAIFGPAGKDLIFSGDAVADKQRRERFLKAYEEKNQLAPEGKNRILVISKQDWPFPIPLVRKGRSWVFDTDKGKQEILNRRIGENELYTIQVCRAIVDAQREFAMKDRDRTGLLEYAQKFLSDPGKTNGLYWESEAGEAQSPLGPIVAQAKSEGYRRQQSGSEPAPYHGYHYKILKAQGKDAPGGAYSYLVKGKMIGGFAVVAYPAQYGNSGVMTFIVNHEGKVFEKNLGKETASLAKRMTEYNPDSTWREVKE